MSPSDLNAVITHIGKCCEKTALESNVTISPYSNIDAGGWIHNIAYFISGCGTILVEANVDFLRVHRTSGSLREYRWQDPKSLEQAIAVVKSDLYTLGLIKKVKDVKNNQGDDNWSG